MPAHGRWGTSPPPFVRRVESHHSPQDDDNPPNWASVSDPVSAAKFIRSSDVYAPVVVLARRVVATKCSSLAGWAE